MGFFNFHSVAKLQKIEGGPFGGINFFEKSRANLKKSKGWTLWSRSVLCYAGNLFGSVPWANRYNLASSQNFVELLVELFWSRQVVFKKH